MKWYSALNRRFQNLGIPIENLRTPTDLSRQIIESFAPLEPFSIDCDYAHLEWNTLQQTIKQNLEPSLKETHQ